jgi:hypothetical protein
MAAAIGASHLLTEQAADVTKAVTEVRALKKYPSTRYSML